MSMLRSQTAEERLISNEGYGSDVSSASSFEDVNEDDNDDLSEYESKAEIDKGSSSSLTTVVWTGWQKKIPVLLFHANAIVSKVDELRKLGERFHLAFKLSKADCKLVRSVLVSHGFHEAPGASNDFNLMWTGSHLKPYVLRTLLDFQKVNHFPRSYEVTRKDRLFKNIQRMQQLKGFRHFDFVPMSFVIPVEYQEFAIASCKDKGPWIVKPVASSRGRGIFLITSADQLPLEDNVIVSRYISNPLLIDGFKFDLRLYVAVTSFDPLIIYLYEEGLARFATVKFDKSFRTLRNQCMHLTNYSVNKKSSEYVQNDDPDVEDYGNKWSLGAMLRYLSSQGIDTTALMMSIEDVLIKTLISVELPIATACKMFMPYRGNCFELFGFDILIDDKLRPWVLEVNLSPSLACDAPLDLKIKSNMLADLFSLVGFVCQDPVTRKLPHDHSSSTRNRMNLRPQSSKPRSKTSLMYRRRRPESASLSSKLRPCNSTSALGSGGAMTSEEIRILRRAKEEYARRGGWVRIFPSTNSWELYSQFMQFTTTHNSLLYFNLLRNRSLNLHCIPNNQLAIGLQNNAILTHASDRCKQYQRKLACLGQKRRHQTTTSISDHQSKSPAVARSSADCVPSDRSDNDSDGEVVPRLTCSTEQTSDAQKAVTQSEATTALDGETLSIVKLLEEGKQMSKVQARFAFAIYLSCIQRRLMDESHHQSDQVGANEQMDLVLKFLQRAASNLQHEFKIVVPSSKLPIGSQKNLLATQLGDFVRIYNAETSHLKKKLRKTPVDGVESLMDDDKFRKFVFCASESQLEEVLTVYTRLSRSASVFLNSNSSRPSSASEMPAAAAAAAAKNPVLPPTLTTSKTGKEDKPSTSEISAVKPLKQDKQHHGPDDGRGSNQGISSNGVVPVPSLQNGGSYRGAVAAYSAKLSQQRPVSAFIPKTSAGDVDSRRIKLSTKQGVNPSSSSSCVTKPHNEHQDTDVTMSMHHLTLRQRQRQYSASVAGNVLTSSNTTKASHGRSVHVRPTESPESLSDDEVVRESRPVDRRRNNVEPTYGRSVSQSRCLPPYEANHAGSEPIRTGPSTEYFDNQRSMIEQTRALLEQSKAKHHALVAHAHTMQKHLQRGRSAGTTSSAYATSSAYDVTAIAPRPPSVPQGDRKMSAHRTHRLVRTFSSSSHAGE